MNSNNQTFGVQINLYDISQGMAKALSPMFLGKQIDGIWHTGVVAYGKEYYFGGGICAGLPKQTPYGYPVQTIEHGETEVPQEIFENFLNEISHLFTQETYDLFKHNCNNFSNECSEFLLGKSIPDYITGLPAEILNTQIGQMIKPMIDQMTQKAAADTSSQHFGGFVPTSPQLNVPQNGGDQQQQMINSISSLLSSSFNQQQQAPLPVVPVHQQPSNAVMTNVIPIEDSEMFICCTESSPKCVIDFYTSWCGPCTTIKPKFAELSIKYTDIMFYNVDIDKAKEIAQQLDVKSIPTFIVFKDGKQIDRWSGGNPITLQQKLEELNK